MSFTKIKLYKEYTVFEPWKFLCEDGPSFRVNGYSIDNNNGNWTFHRGPGLFRVEKVI